MQRLLFYSQMLRGTVSEFNQIVKANAAILREEWESVGLRHLAVFSCDLYVCVYAETVEVQSTSMWDWPASFDRYLEKWPTEPDHYHELPAQVNPTKRQGLLSTKNTPNNWHEVMYPHCDLWEDAAEGQQIWRKMERLM